MINAFVFILFILVKFLNFKVFVKFKQNVIKLFCFKKIKENFLFTNNFCVFNANKRQKTQKKLCIKLKIINRK